MDGPFVDPPWTEPLDVEAALAAIPEDASIQGFFLAGVRDLARQSGVTLPSAQVSYLAFKSYPLREHASLMAECARLVWPALPVRHALRKMGRGAAGALIGSGVGKVSFGGASSPHDIVRAMARAYAAHGQPAEAEVIDEGATEITVRLKNVVYFLDSHHPGVFEGAMRHAKVDGVTTPSATVQIAVRGANDADLRIAW